MSSSFPAARFPGLQISQEKTDSRPVAEITPHASEELSDETLLSQIATGDQEALGLLFRRYARLVWSVAERIVRENAEADDLLQDVFLLIQRRAAVFDSSKGTVRSLIVHMTYQRALSRRSYLNSRHHQPREDAEEQPVEPSAPCIPLYDESIEAHFGRERLREALESLSEDQRKTIRLYFFEGYNFAEIGECLGQSMGQVKHHYYRGLQGLRRYLPQG